MRPVKTLLLLSLLILVSLSCDVINRLPLLQAATPTIPQPPLQTPLPSATPSPVPSPTPTPTPTPLPEARLEAAQEALFYGDWERALAEYQAVLASNPLPEIQAAALLGIGRAQYLSRKYPEAEQTLLQLIQTAGESPNLADAYFYLGQVYDSEERHLEAAQAYLDYLALRPGLIDAYIYELRGDALAAAGDYPGAIVEYQAALGSPRLSSDLDLEIKMARTYALSGDYPTAVVAYQDLYTRTSNNQIKSQLALLLGEAFTAVDDVEQAQAAYLDAVLNYPTTYDAYVALLRLVEDGVAVDEMSRGLVDYYAGEYGVALAAFDRYLQADPADPATGLYYRGLSLGALGEHQVAIESWDQVIAGYPDADRWDEAWEMKAYTLWFHLDDFTAAVESLSDFVETVPTHPRAAEFLFDAASIAERQQKLNKAANLWERTATEYPQSEQASRARFLAGIARYRLADFAAAGTIFEGMLAQTLATEERAAAFLWLGKSHQASGDPQAAQTAWEQGAELDPTGYYSERARDLLAGLTPFTPPQEYDLSFDLDAEKVEAEAWIRTVFALPEDTDLSGLGELQADPRLQRGNEFWRLSLYQEARAEFEHLYQEVSSDPTQTYRLVNHFLELGLYRSAILAARQILTLAGMDDAETMSAPVFFNHIRFGPYYRDLVISAAQTYNFHPLFLFSVIRQESLFEGFISSSASARGLMQIIPSTGQEVAANAGWPPDYQEADLYRPLVSLTLGADYLNRQRAFLGGDFYAALAAYNGGPGNAATWQKLVPPDPDLFLEVIRFEETRNYIRRIAEIFSIYRRLYDRTP
jgi:soluble lytic murein transglycosylase